MDSASAKKMEQAPPHLRSDQTIAKLTHQVTDQMKKTGEQWLESSESVVRRGVELSKKYPLHTAVGALCMGFVAGVLSSKWRS